MELPNTQINDVIDYIIKKVRLDHKVSKVQARKLIIEAMTYGYVIDDILRIVDNLIIQYEI